MRNISHPDCLPGLSENEFAFGGDGYVSLGNKGFEQRKFSQIKFSFKTSMDEGLIYLTATPDGHFESVELRNGKVIYQFQLNSGQVELATERRYDDGKWHVLEVRWTPEDSSSLVIDDSVGKNKLFLLRELSLMCTFKMTEIGSESCGAMSQ